MNGPQDTVIWYDSADYSNRRRITMWQPSGISDGGYIMHAERSDPGDVWPGMKIAKRFPDPVSLDFARAFAVGFGCVHSPDSYPDPAPATEREPDPVGAVKDVVISVRIEIRGTQLSLEDWAAAAENALTGKTDALRTAPQDTIRIVARDARPFGLVAPVRELKGRVS